MALIKCPECGREMSNTATSCPGCGYQIKQYNSDTDQIMDLIEYSNKRLDEISNILRVFLLLIIIGILIPICVLIKYFV